MESPTSVLCSRSHFGSMSRRELGLAAWLLKFTPAEPARVARTQLRQCFYSWRWFARGLRRGRRFGPALRIVLRFNRLRGEAYWRERRLRVAFIRIVFQQIYIQTLRATGARLYVR